MRKTLKNTAECCHVWANQLQIEGKSGNIFFRENKIYSYGHHYEIASIETAPNGDKVYFINSNGYSNSTAKHTNHVRQSIPKGENLFSVPFHFDKIGSYYLYSQSFETSHLPAIIDRMKVEVNNLLSDQLKARTNNYLFGQAENKINNIRRISSLFNLSIPEYSEFPQYEQAQVKSLEINRTNVIRQQEQQERQAKKDIENLSKWLRYEYNGQLYNIPVHLRLSKDSENIETTKGARVNLSEALTLLNKIESKADTIGDKIGGYKITEVTDKDITIGCHVITFENIYSFMDKIGAKGQRLRIA